MITNGLNTLGDPFLTCFYCYFFASSSFFPFVAEKDGKTFFNISKMISTSERHAGRNTQHIAQVCRQWPPFTDFPCSILHEGTQKH